MISLNNTQAAPDPFTRYSGLELRHLRLVWTVAEERGLTRASRRLRLTPSAISHQLRQLEGVTGAPIFHRDGKTMKLTAAGDVLLEAASRVLGVVAEAEDRLGKLRQGSAGLVRLSTHCYTGYHWLPDVIKTFRVENPDVDVRIVGEATRRPIEALLGREIDIALTTDAPADERLRVRPIVRDEMMLVVAPDHPLAKKRKAEPAEIAREHLLLYADRPERSLFCIDVLRSAGVWPHKFTSIQLTEAILEMVKARLGVTVLAEWAVEPSVRSGHLAAVRIGRGGWLRTWNAITWPAAEAGPLVGAFAEHLAKSFVRRKKLREVRVA